MARYFLDRVRCWAVGGVLLAASSALLYFFVATLTTTAVYAFPLSYVAIRPGALQLTLRLDKKSPAPLFAIDHDGKKLKSPLVYDDLKGVSGWQVLCSAAPSNCPFLPTVRFALLALYSRSPSCFFYVVPLSVFCFVCNDLFRRF